MWGVKLGVLGDALSHIPMLLENHETFSYRVSQHECSEKKLTSIKKLYSRVNFSESHRHLLNICFPFS